ncbi:hypothetical protein Tco_0849142 [Tanacetum coccineum]
MGKSSSTTNARYIIDKARKGVNTKFLNNLPPEWSKFVTDVKLEQELILKEHEGTIQVNKRDATWFRDKVLLVKAQGNGKVLNESFSPSAVKIILGLTPEMLQALPENRQLTNFVHKFLCTVKFGNNQVAKIMGYGDYQIRNFIISRVYYVEGLGHNLFSVGQFCDSDLEVAFRKYTCFVRNLEGVDLLLGSRRTNLYSFSIGDMMASSPICLLSKATKTKS